MTTDHYLSPDRKRLISLLRALADLNGAGKAPNASDLVRADDGRTIVPGSTMSQRRALVWELVRLQYVNAYLMAGNPRKLLHITKEGYAALNQIDSAK